VYINLNLRTLLDMSDGCSLSPNVVIQIRIVVMRTIWLNDNQYLLGTSACLESDANLLRLINLT
jgi:hypothetical protein